jgi:hypothetical protein
MIDLRKLKKRIEDKAGETINKGSRKRNIVYYRKIFCKIAHLFGYSLSRIGQEIDLAHDNVLFHKNSIDVIHLEHRIFFNELVDEYGLTAFMEIKEDVKEIKDETKLNYVKLLLSPLSDGELDSFIETRIIPFLKINKYKHEYN